EPRDQRGGLALESSQELAVPVGDRVRAGNAARSEVVHQAEVERQLVETESFEQREHEAAAVGRDEEVAVLDARRDAFEAAKLAEVIAFEPAREFLARDGREDGHGLWSAPPLQVEHAL